MYVPNPLPPSQPLTQTTTPTIFPAQDDWEKHGADKCKPRALIIDGPTLMLASKEGVRRRLLKLTRVGANEIYCDI